jgi:hypothetical protein
VVVAPDLRGPVGSGGGAELRPPAVEAVPDPQESGLIQELPAADRAPPRRFLGSFLDSFTELLTPTEQPTTVWGVFLWAAGLALGGLGYQAFRQRRRARARAAAAAEADTDTWLPGSAGLPPTDPS